MGERSAGPAGWDGCARTLDEALPPAPGIATTSPTSPTPNVTPSPRETQTPEPSRSPLRHVNQSGKCRSWQWTVGRPAAVLPRPPPGVGAAARSTRLELGDFDSSRGGQRRPRAARWRLELEPAEQPALGTARAVRAAPARPRLGTELPVRPRKPSLALRVCTQRLSLDGGPVGAPSAACSSSTSPRWPRSPVRKDGARGRVRKPANHGRGRPYYGSRATPARPLGEQDRGALETAWKRGRGAAGPARSVRNRPLAHPRARCLNAPPPLWLNREASMGSVTRARELRPVALARAGAWACPGPVNGACPSWHEGGRAGSWACPGACSWGLRSVASFQFSFQPGLWRPAGWWAACRRGVRDPACGAGWG
jgi:hypothetical protein